MLLILIAFALIAVAALVLAGRILRADHNARPANPADAEEFWAIAFRLRAEGVGR